MSRWKGSPVLRLLSDLVLRPFNGRGLGVGDGSIDDFPQNDVWEMISALLNIF